MDVFRTGRVQIDDPVISCFCDATCRERMAQAGVDPRRLLDTYFALYNDCLRDKPIDMFVGLHVCRGNIKVSVCLFLNVSKNTRSSCNASARRFAFYARRVRLDRGEALH